MGLRQQSVMPVILLITIKSIGRELINDGKLPLEGVTMPIILDYFHKHPQELNIYIPRDPSFVFFQENHGAASPRFY